MLQQLRDNLLSGLVTAAALGGAGAMGFALVVAITPGQSGDEPSRALGRAEAVFAGPDDSHAPAGSMRDALSSNPDPDAMLEMARDHKAGLLASAEPDPAQAGSGERIPPIAVPVVGVGTGTQMEGLRTGGVAAETPPSPTVPNQGRPPSNSGTSGIALSSSGGGGSGGGGSAGSGGRPPASSGGGGGGPGDAGGGDAISGSAETDTVGNATIGLSGGDAGGIGPNQELIDTPHDQLGADWTDDQFEADSPAAELPDEPIDPDTYEKPLILLDEVRAQGAPDLVGDHGFQPIIVLYPPTLWGLDAPIDEPDEERFELIGSQLPDGSLVCLDIEHWETSAARAPIEEVERSIDKLIASVEAVRRGNPTLKIGIYSMIPVREWHVPQWMYWREIPNQTVYNWHDYWDERVQQWDEDNERLQRLASHVDVIFPSLYTFDNDIEAWTRYARANMEEARRYGKPVYPFIWTRFTYTAINNNAGQPIPADLWQHQIRLLHLIADGVVIWNSLSDTWDPDAEWWSATQAYQQEIEDNPLIYWGD